MIFGIRCASRGRQLRVCARWSMPCVWLWGRGSRAAVAPATSCRGVILLEFGGVVFHYRELRVGSRDAILVRPKLLLHR